MKRCKLIKAEKINLLSMKELYLFIKKNVSNIVYYINRYFIFVLPNIKVPKKEKKYEII